LSPFGVAFFGGLPSCSSFLIFVRSRSPMSSRISFSLRTLQNGDLANDCPFLHLSPFPCCVIYLPRNFLIRSSRPPVFKPRSAPTFPPFPPATRRSFYARYTCSSFQPPDPLPVVDQQICHCLWIFFFSLPPQPFRFFPSSTDQDADCSPPSIFDPSPPPPPFSDFFLLFLFSLRPTR